MSSFCESDESREVKIDHMDHDPCGIRMQCFWALAASSGARARQTGDCREHGGLIDGTTSRAEESDWHHRNWTSTDAALGDVAVYLFP